MDLIYSPLTKPELSGISRLVDFVNNFLYPVPLTGKEKGIICDFLETKVMRSICFNAEVGGSVTCHYLPNDKINEFVVFWKDHTIVVRHDRTITYSNLETARIEVENENKGD